jgi:hypothetical protein
MLSRVLASGMTLGLAAALIIAARIAHLEEAFSSRTTTLLVLAAIGGGAGALVLSALSLRFARGWPRALTAAIAFLLATPGIVGAFALTFSIHNRYIASALESVPYTAEWFSEAIWSLLGGVGLFLQTGTRYWLPWPAPVFGLVAAIVIAGFAPRRTRP